jgi:multiple sugar transport system substrate-binding protein
MTAVTTGCFSGQSDADGDGGSGPQLKQWVKPMGEEEQASLTVYGGYLDERSFIYNYGNSYLVKFPNIELTFERKANNPGTPNVEADQMGDLLKLLDEKKPDVLLLSLDEMEKLAAKGMLLNLDPLIKMSKFDLSGLHAGAVEAIRSKGGGNLYGLSPFFTNSALYYNKDLFDKYNVPYPKDRMSWSELLQLAKRFPTTGTEESRVYGLQINGGLDSFVQQMARSQAVFDVTADGSKVVTTDEAHKRIWNEALDGVRGGYVDLLQDNSQHVDFKTPTFSSPADPFTAGRAAMAIKPTRDALQLSMLKDSNLKPFDWQLVTTPVDPKSPDESVYFNGGTVFAISAKSPNVRAAWQLVNYWNSDEYAAYFSRAMGTSIMRFGQLLTRTAFNKEIDGRSLEPFMALKPNSRIALYGYDPNVSAAFGAAYSKIVTEESKAMLDGKKTVEEALSSMQELGQMELDAANK